MQGPVQMNELPTPRELLIALNADELLPRRELDRLAAELAGWAQAPLAAGRRPALAAPAHRESEALAGGELPALAQGKGRPAWSTPAGAIAAAAAATAAAADLEARIVTVLDAEYPAQLARLALPPPVLFVRGELPPGPMVAIVGSRLGDVYGRDAASRFARYLAAAGVGIVSGLARGIDAAAHHGALAVASGRTVAVLGCGMGVDYPRGHGRLAAAIAERGFLVSEFPCGASPRRWHFPVRNRTIAALADVTLVVQATPRSGSLATARHARQLGRPVFALPGPVFEPLSWGPHSLLRGGALLAGHPQDILDALPALPASFPDSVPSGEAGVGKPALAAAVLAALRRRAASTVERLAARAGAAPDAVLSTLLELEVAGRVERLPGMAYRLAPSPVARRRTAAKAAE